MSRRNVLLAVGVMLVLAVIAGAVLVLHGDDSPAQDDPQRASQSESEVGSDSRPPQKTEVVAGKETVVETGELTITVPDGAAPAGAELLVEEVVDWPDQLLDGPVYDVSLDGDLTAPATIKMGFDREALPDGADPLLYTWVDEAQRWLLQAAAIEGDMLVAETMHFSWWSWGRPNYIVGQLTGDRTDEPICSDGLPSWAIGEFVHQDDINAAVYTCAEDGGKTARVKLKANRGDPILVEFSHTPKVVGGSDQSRWMTELLQERWPRRAFIETRTELVVEFTQPDRASVIEAKRWGGDGARYATTALVMFLEDVVSGAKGKLPKLYRAAKCVFDAKQFGEGDDDVFVGVGQSLGFLTSCIEDQLENFRATGLLSNTDYRRLSQAFAYWKFADTFNKIMDVVLIDSNDTAPYFSISTRRPEAPEPDFIRVEDPTDLVNIVIGAWVSGDPGRLRAYAADPALLEPLGVAPSQTWQSECEGGSCWVKMVEDFPDHQATVGNYEVVLGYAEAQGWWLISIADAYPTGGEDEYGGDGVPPECQPPEWDPSCSAYYD